MVISSRRHNTCSLCPYRFDTPLSFVSRRRRPCVWYVGHGRREATSDRLIASAERPVTIIPLTIGLSITGKNRFRQTGYRFRKINGFNIPNQNHKPMRISKILSLFSVFPPPLSNKSALLIFNFHSIRNFGPMC